MKTRLERREAARNILSERVLFIGETMEDFSPEIAEQYDAAIESISSLMGSIQDHRSKATRSSSEVSDE